MYFRSLKNIGLAFFCLVLITGFVPAQETVISEDEYRLKMGRAMAATMLRDYRLTIEIISYDLKSPQTIVSQNKFVHENIGNRENRRTRDVRTFRLGDKVEQKEIITIGNDIYTQNGNESWGKSLREEKQSEQRTSLGETRPTMPNTFAYLGKEVFGEWIADVYRTTKNWEITTDKNVKMQVSLIERSWLSPDGLLLKTEVENFDGEGNKRSTTIRTYEHPEGLKIEAPIK